VTLYHIITTPTLHIVGTITFDTTVAFIIPMLALLTSLSVMQHK
jgi:hypothetical protein